MKVNGSHRTINKRNNMDKNNNKPMITISAEDFWKKLNDIEDKLTITDINNKLGHAEIISHQKITNGRVKMNRTLIYGIIASILPILGLMFALII